MNFTKVTMILRGYTYEQVRVVANILAGSKIKNMEITLNTENAIDIIYKISEEFKDQLNIGAGTVLTFDELKQATQAGAKFILSPKMMEKNMIIYCKNNDVISIPGAFTPSEIAESFKNGADIVKIFPANELSIDYAKKVIEPLGDLALMAVGGVNKDNVKRILESGYSHVGTAGGIFKKEDIISMNIDKLKESLYGFENNLT